MKKIALLTTALMFAAVALCGCNNAGQTTETTEAAVLSETTAITAETAAAKTETAAATQSNDLGIETLAAGETRDWTIEDVLKNDLSVGGVPVSLPCSKKEFLKTMGKGYSVGEHSKLRFKREETTLDLSIIDKKTVHGFMYFKNMSSSYKAVDFNFTGVDNMDSISDFVSKYDKPNEVETDENGKVTLIYNDGEYSLWCTFKGDKLGMIFIGLKTGENN